MTLYFVGRLDQVIKSRGEKVAPEEVDRALLAIDGGSSRTWCPGTLRSLPTCRERRRDH